jgi:hypothetical protein
VPACESEDEESQINVEKSKGRNRFLGTKIALKRGVKTVMN